MISKKYKKKTTKSPFVMFPKLIEWLATLMGFSSKGREFILIMQVTDKILTMLKHRGKRETIRYVKNLRLKFLKFILSISSEWKSTDQQSFPRFFRPVVKLILNSKSHPLIRLTFSCLYFTRFIRIREVETEFQSIQERPLYKGTPEDLREDIFFFLKDLGVNTKHGLGKVPRKLRFNQFHMTSKRGPNGHALWTSYKDLFCLSPASIYNLRILAGDKIVELMSKFIHLYQRIPIFFDQFSAITGSKRSRRLSVIPDKEGKQREIAIFSYYEQAALLPLHKFLMKQLSRIQQDCTDNQTKLFNLIDADEGSSYHSIDLKAFTDRFPIVINKEILSVWFGDEYAEAWRSTMVDTPFIYDDREIFYRTGNPMGSYSSWASTTLAHHFFIWLACKKANVKWKKCPYMLLGDDIVIANDNVAQEYKNLLSEWGIEYSKEKTHVSPYGFEFAKQIRLHGENVSPFPLSAIYDRFTEPFTGLGIIVAELSDKGWDLDIIAAVEGYYTKIKGWPFPYYRKKEPEIWLIIGFILFLQGKADLGTVIHMYAERTGQELKPWFQDPQSPTWRHEVGMMSMEVLRRTFKLNRDRIINPKTGGSLGDLATQMVIHITSLRDGGEDCFDLIESVPFLQVYGRAEERFLQLNQELEHIDTIQSGQFLYEPWFFRSLFEQVDIPLSDSGFYTRHRDVLVTHSMKASKIIAEIIRTDICA